MSWIKSLGIGLKVAFFAFLAAMALAAAKRQKDIANQWKDKAIDIELGNVVKGTQTAQAASSQAKIYDARAKQIKAKAEARKAEQNKSIESLIDKWKK